MSDMLNTRSAQSTLPTHTHTQSYFGQLDYGSENPPTAHLRLLSHGYHKPSIRDTKLSRSSRLLQDAALVRISSGRKPEGYNT